MKRMIYVATTSLLLSVPRRSSGKRQRLLQTRTKPRQGLGRTRKRPMLTSLTDASKSSLLARRLSLT